MLVPNAIANATPTGGNPMATPVRATPARAVVPSAPAGAPAAQPPDVFELPTIAYRADISLGHLAARVAHARMQGRARPEPGAEAPPDDVAARADELGAVIPVGLRQDLQAARASIMSLAAVIQEAAQDLRRARPDASAAEVFDHAGVPPITVLAHPSTGRPTGVILDGALRYAAAVQAGLDRIPARAVALDRAVPIEIEWLRRNLRHGLRPSDAEIASALRDVAHRYREARGDAASASQFAEEISRMLAIPPGLIVRYVKPVFSTMTDQARESLRRDARAMADAGDPPVVIIAVLSSRYGVSRTLIRHVLRDLGVLNPSPSAKAESAAARHAVGIAQVSAVAAPAIDPRRDARDLEQAARNPGVAGLQAVLDAILPHLDGVDPGTADQIWAPIDPLWVTLLRAARRAQVHRIRRLARRDAEILADLAALAASSRSA
jgi:hypothetical protein